MFLERAAARVVVIKHQILAVCKILDVTQAILFALSIFAGTIAYITLQEETICRASNLQTHL